MAHDHNKWLLYNQLKMLHLTLKPTLYRSAAGLQGSVASVLHAFQLLSRSRSQWKQMKPGSPDVPLSRSSFQLQLQSQICHLCSAFMGIPLCLLPV